MRATLVPVLALIGCGPSVDADAGGDALLHVEGGTFRRGAIPAENGGPAVLAAFLGRTALGSGEQDKSFSGVLAEDATAVAIGLQGDAGFFTVPAGLPQPEAPEQPSFSAPLSFSSEIPAGPGRLLVAAVDAGDRYGARLALDVTFTGVPRPEGALVVTLAWEPASDLDLHVELPDGTEAERDFDSNADCALDRRNSEHVVLSEVVPSGRYAVRVDTVSLCGESVAYWSARAVVGGVLVASAQGTSTGAATRGAHGRGAGVQALSFDVP